MESYSQSSQDMSTKVVNQTHSCEYYTRPLGTFLTICSVDGTGVLPQLRAYSPFLGLDTKKPEETAKSEARKVEMDKITSAMADYVEAIQSMLFLVAGLSWTEL